MYGPIEMVENLIETMLDKFGKVDFLINNGGGQFPSPAQDISLKGWTAVIETNLMGTFLMCREVYNRWMKDNGGVIVNIIADMWKGFPGMSHTGAARAGVHNLTKSLAIEWASSGVRLNCVAPRLLQPIMDPIKCLNPRYQIYLLNVLALLKSPGASFISGDTIKVDGAHSLYRPSMPWDINDSTSVIVQMSSLVESNVVMKMDRKVVCSVFRKGLFEGKTAIVTGGGTGIGKAITQELLFLGCHVMIASRKIDRLSAAAKEIRLNVGSDQSGHLEFMQCNIRKEDQVVNLIETMLDKFGKIDFLINNGGGQFLSPAQDITLKGWNAVIETNLMGTFFMCREGFQIFSHFSHTGAARAGVHNLTKSLAIEWASSGVRLNCVAPGSSIYSETAATNYGSNKVFESQIPNIPAKRLGTTEEVSAAVMFLLSPGASFISGDTIKVDGAHSLYRPSMPWAINDHDKLPAYTWEQDDKQSATTTTRSKL
ncbi:hypothetical protein LSH36_1423g00055 [Paralvinella palmiformis]|uniref:Peroxisomal trans-2-enoyl-CoA reductase n=1 Tax=Paralvinella palmiformis TaxID=53620 RepID=A0AAD9ITH9_9ANNE|nr:hypothetical protein LSH36_1423g00055 [Paralvinella palmiformis]